MTSNRASAGGRSGPLLKGNRVKEDMPIPAREQFQQWLNKAMILSDRLANRAAMATSYGGGPLAEKYRGEFQAARSILALHLEAAPPAPPPQHSPAMQALRDLVAAEDASTAALETAPAPDDTIAILERLDAAWERVRAVDAAPVAQPLPSDTVNLTAAQSGTVQTALSGWQPLATAPQDWTEILVRYPLQGNVKKLVSWNCLHHYWQSKGEPVIGLEYQQAEWHPLPADSLNGADPASPKPATPEATKDAQEVPRG